MNLKNIRTITTIPEGVIVVEIEPDAPEMTYDESMSVLKASRSMASIWLNCHKDDAAALEVLVSAAPEFKDKPQQAEHLLKLGKSFVDANIPFNFEQSSYYSVK